MQRAPIIAAHARPAWFRALAPHAAIHRHANYRPAVVRRLPRSDRRRWPPRPRRHRAFFDTIDSRLLEPPGPDLRAKLDGDSDDSYLGTTNNSGDRCGRRRL